MLSPMHSHAYFNTTIHSHDHSCILVHTLFYTLSHTFSNSLTLQYTHTLSLSLSLIHTYTLSHAHTHIPFKGVKATTPQGPASFSFQLTNGPIKLEYSITLGRKWLSGTNTLAYWAHVYTILMKFDPTRCLFNQLSLNLVSQLFASPFHSHAISRNRERGKTLRIWQHSQDFLRSSYVRNYETINLKFNNHLCAKTFCHYIEQKKFIRVL